MPSKIGKTELRGGFRVSFTVAGYSGDIRRRSAGGLSSQTEILILPDFSSPRSQSSHFCLEAAASDSPIIASVIARTTVVFPEPLSPMITCQPGAFFGEMRQCNFSMERMFSMSTLVMYIAFPGANPERSDSSTIMPMYRKRMNEVNLDENASKQAAIAG